MSTLFQDQRLYKILSANIFSSIGTGVTMIAIPWLLVTEKGGAVILGFATICMTIAQFILAPYIGYMIDKLSRRAILIVGEVIGSIIISLFAIYGIVNGNDYELWMLIVLFAMGGLYYSLFYPTMFAFNQEIFTKEQYKSLNGVMEIQGQLSTVIAGGIATILISRVDLSLILLLDAMTYGGAALMFYLIPYKRAQESGQSNDSLLYKLAEGYHYMKKSPMLFLFFLASFMPFIGVMVSNYLNPIYIANVLEADASAYGTSGMIYGVGAIVAGIIIPLFAKKIGNERSIVITVCIYSIAITMLAIFPYLWVFYIVKLFTAFGNAGTRVARNSLLMELIPNDKIGRVDSLFRVIGLGIRIVLLIVFTRIISDTSAIIPFGILSVVLLVAAMTVIITYVILFDSRSRLNKSSEYM
ncbi:MFS transporter [Bacillus sp. SM2101]|uniref:MFS transporter n=1 Tax=Bacillus sp. SM2101 TaxID=2805366 RepID=UPI001BDECDE4|nr:MFS transporter [Bacillus sp. SM2101]